METQPLVGDKLPAHLLLDDRHRQVEGGRDLEPATQAEDGELHREDLLVRVVGVHAHREELSLAEAYPRRRVEGVVRGLEELAPPLHPLGQDRVALAKGLDDGSADLEHLD